MRHLPLNNTTKFLLFLIAVPLFIALSPIGFVFTLIRCLFRMSVGKTIGYLSNLAFAIAEGLDRLGNVVCRDLLNATLIHSGGYDFGQMEGPQSFETISRVLGMNKELGTLTDLGRGLANLLNWIDPNHVEKSI